MRPVTAVTCLLRARLPRPGRMLPAALLALALATTACQSSPGSNAEDAGDNDANAKPFSFTDDRGETVSLDTSDVRIVAQEDAAQALMHLGIKPVGIFGGAPMDKNPMLEGLDLTGVESLGETWGEIKMEKLAALQPDVIVSTFYTCDGVLFEGGVYGFGTEKQQNDAQQIAPILAMDATQPSSKVIERFGELATALGADVDSGQYSEERAEFEAAVEDLQAAAKESDASVLAVTPATDAVYVAVPKAFADTQDLMDWGVNMMEPTGKLVSSYYESLSWENAANYQPDVILIDTRGYTLGESELEQEYPTWTDIKAVQDGNIGTWVRISFNYPDYTERVQQLTQLLEGTATS
jgi:iron complex transport system substrate-binding protein